MAEGFELTLEEIEMFEKERIAIESAEPVLFFAKETPQGWKVTCDPQEGQKGFLSFWLAFALCAGKEGKYVEADYAIEMSKVKDDYPRYNWKQWNQVQ